MFYRKYNGLDIKSDWFARNSIFSHKQPPTLVVRVRLPPPILNPVFSGWDPPCTQEQSNMFHSEPVRALQPPNCSDGFGYGHVIQWQPMEFTRTFSWNFIDCWCFCQNYRKACRLVLLYTFSDKLRRAKVEKISPHNIPRNICHKHVHIYRKGRAILQQSHNCQPLRPQY